MQKISINGRELPCRMTMGALRRFKAESGKEVSEIGSEVSEIGTLLWACVASACKADGIEFGMSVDDFADLVDLETINQFAASMTSAGGDNSQKKMA